MTTHARGAKLRLVWSGRELRPGTNFDPVTLPDPLEARWLALLRLLERRARPDDEPEPPEAA